MRRLVADGGGGGTHGLRDHLAAEDAAEPVGLAVNAKTVIAHRFRRERTQQAVERALDRPIQLGCGGHQIRRSCAPSRRTRSCCLRSSGVTLGVSAGRWSRIAENATFLMV